MKELEEYFDRLWPILRSITGEGVRMTHAILGELVPLERIELPSGTPIFDWTVPREWLVREAYAIDPRGDRILDIADNNLHLIGYSAPFQGTISRQDLDAHLFSLPAQPDAIPYLTSYYQERWGFCLSQRQRDALPEGSYKVVIDTEFTDGSLTLSEAVIPGESDDEVLISTYTCHPSMANNELSGPLVSAFLARQIAAWPRRRLTYRFVFGPETIGTIAYLWLRGEHLKRRMVAGYVVTCVGLDRPFTYQRSQRGNTVADRCAMHALETLGLPFNFRDFHPTGSDERQYCSPGFDLPVGSLLRGSYIEYPEYHTSLDNKSLISFDALRGSVRALEKICRTLDANVAYRNLFPYGEPNLGKRNLYPMFRAAEQREWVRAILWFLNQSNGSRDLIEISDRSGIPLDRLHEAATACLEKGLVEVSPSSSGTVERELRPQWRLTK